MNHSCTDNGGETVKKEMKITECDDGVPHIGKARKELLQQLACEHGTPIFVIDHEKIRSNYREFKKVLPKIQVYYAVKANSNPEIVRTLYDMGSSFDVASMPEFMIVYENIKKMPKKERQAWIWDKIIYANTIKPIETLEALDHYKPLVTFDNCEELKKIKAACTPCGPCPSYTGTKYRFHGGTLFKVRGSSG